MMFHNILILVKDKLELDHNMLEKIKNIFVNNSINFVNFNNFKKINLNKVDLVISIGGDGTFIKAANLIENIPIIGINANPETSEGALTSLDINNLDQLTKLLKNEFVIEIKHRAKVKLNNREIDEIATNEIYVGALSQFHSSRYIIHYNGKKEEHRSSGVIISTGMGSAAWFYSAGGEIFKHDEEKLSFIIREPYKGKRIFVPKIFKGDIRKNEKLIIESKRDFGGVLAINDVVYDFNNGDIVEIELSEKPLGVIRLK